MVGGICLGERRAVLTFLVFALLVCSGCLLAPAVEKKQLSVVLNNWPPSYNIYTAQQKGYFGREGVEEEIIRYDDYMNALSNFQKNRSIDCLHIVATDLFTLREQGVRAKMIIPIDTSAGADVLIARSDVGSISGLRGKTVGVEGFNSFSHMFAIRLLQKHNMSEDDVRFKIVSSIDVPEQIASGAIDGGHVYASSLSRSLQLGQKKVGDSSEVPALIFDGIACRESAIEDRPEDIQKMTNAWYSALRLQNENRTEALEAISKETKIPLGELGAEQAGIVIFDLEDGRAAFSALGGGGSLTSVLEETNDFLQERGQASKNVLAQELVDERFVQNTR